jgi:hypothetical protein
VEKLHRKSKALQQLENWRYKKPKDRSTVLGLPFNLHNHRAKPSGLQLLQAG